MKVYDLFKTARMSTMEIVKFYARRNIQVTEEKVYNTIHRQREERRAADAERRAS